MRRGRNGGIQRSPLSYRPVLYPERDTDEPLVAPKRPTASRQVSRVAHRPGAFDVTAAIRTFKLFETAPEELIELIMQRMRSRVVEKGDEICREGDDAKAMYWIIRGAVAVVSRDTESKFAELHSGQFFG